MYSVCGLTICDEETEVSDEDVIEELFYPLDFGDE